MPSRAGEVAVEDCRSPASGGNVGAMSFYVSTRLMPRKSNLSSRKRKLLKADRRSCSRHRSPSCSMENHPSHHQDAQAALVAIRFPAPYVAFCFRIAARSAFAHLPCSFGWNACNTNDVVPLASILFFSIRRLPLAQTREFGHHDASAQATNIPAWTDFRWAVKTLPQTVKMRCWRWDSLVTRSDAGDALSAHHPPDLCLSPTACP